MHQVVAGCLQKVGATESGPLHQGKLTELRAEAGSTGGGSCFLSDTNQPPSSDLGQEAPLQHDNPLSSQWSESTEALASFEADDPESGQNESGLSDMVEPLRPPPQHEDTEALPSFEAEDPYGAASLDAMLRGRTDARLAADMNEPPGAPPPLGL